MRFVGQIGAYHAHTGAGFGPMRPGAAPRVAPTHAVSSHACSTSFVAIDAKAPQGGAQAP
jgi:hypothetical protein